jgi:hypothetical protein
MARQYWVAPIPPFHTADGPAVTGGTVLADMSPAPPIVLGGNLLEVGSRLEFQAYGRYTSAATPGTAVLGVYLGASASAIAAGMALAVTATLTLPASQTNRTWRMEGNAAVRSVGTTGTIIACMEFSNVTAGATDLAPSTAPAAATVDTTANLSARLGVTPSLATQSWTCHHWGVRLVT